VTGSPRAAQLLHDWERASEGFWRIAPKTELDRVAASEGAGARSG
jgi:glutamate synthase domain-containing protein 3